MSIEPQVELKCAALQLSGEVFPSFCSITDVVRCCTASKHVYVPKL